MIYKISELMLAWYGARLLRGPGKQTATVSSASCQGSLKLSECDREGRIDTESSSARMPGTSSSLHRRPISNRLRESASDSPVVSKLRIAKRLRERHNQTLGVSHDTRATRETGVPSVDPAFDAAEAGGVGGGEVEGE